jgi:ParB family transcriptional regulator, chromosome partitioning protein
VSPALIQLYRDGGIRLEQLEALAISNDHEAQERVWNTAHEWERTPSALRRALTQSTVEGEDKRVLFVGLETYLQRGGGIERDLFDAEHDGFLSDPKLLETLVTEKLQAEAERLKAEGWSWVEINRTEDGWQAARAYQQLRPKSVSLSEDLQAEADRLINERETLQSKDEDDYCEEDEDRLEAINRRLEIIEATRYVFTPKQKSLSGVMIGITFNGQLAADYGLTQKTCLKGYRRVGRCAVC